MIIFWRLLLGHFLADFTLQANWVNKWKRESIIGLLIHCLMHPICYLALTYPFLSETWVEWKMISINGYWAIVLITLLHFLEDYWRVYTIHRFKTPDNTLYLFWDQIIHVSVIFIFFGTGNMNYGLFPEKWPVVGILAIGATHFSVVLVYFLENEFGSSAYPKTADKYLAITERLLAFISLAFVHNAALAWLLALSSLIIPRFELQVPLRTKKLPNKAWVMGSVMALICGLLARMLLF